MGIHRSSKSMTACLAAGAGTLTFMACVSAPSAAADQFGQPCNDTDLIMQPAVAPGQTTGEPPIMCVQGRWGFISMPSLNTRQILGAPCSVPLGITAYADDPQTGKLYFSMCYNREWTRYRP